MGLITLKVAAPKLLINDLRKGRGQEGLMIFQNLWLVPYRTMLVEEATI